MLHQLLVASAQKSFTDVVHHRQAGGTHLLTELWIVAKFRTSHQLANPIALQLRGLPHAKILEAVDTHAESRGMLGTAPCSAAQKSAAAPVRPRTTDQGHPRTKDGPRTKDQGL